MQLARRSIPLDGAIVVVTGGARGIGAKTAELFSQHGANVWIGDVDVDIAEQTARKIPAVAARGSMSPGASRGISSSRRCSRSPATSTSW